MRWRIALFLFMAIVMAALVYGRNPYCDDVCQPVYDCVVGQGCRSDCEYQMNFCCNDLDCADGKECVNYECIITQGCGDGLCGPGENMCTCSRDCYSRIGYICCDDIPIDGDCCNDADCIGEELCIDNKCQEPTPPSETCDDLLKNQDETDVDCGGSCDPCPNGGLCNVSSDCQSGYCELGICDEEPVCEEGETQNCTADNGCSGSITCTDNAWGSCETDLYNCDTNCDGELDTCQESDCLECDCIDDVDCAEQDCKIVSCEGEPKVCVYTDITECSDDDGCCPEGCVYSNDNDCNATDECEEDSECVDDDFCTDDFCEGEPKVCVHYPVENCISGDGCCLENCSFAEDMDCSCTPNFECGEWYPEICPKERRQKRDCWDTNNCTNRTKTETKLCKYVRGSEPLVGQGGTQGTELLTRRKIGVGNNTNTTLNGEDPALIEIESRANKNYILIGVLMGVVLAGIIYFMYHEGLLDTLIKKRTKEYKRRRAEMFRRIKFFRDHAQSDVMIKTNLLAENFTLEEIKSGIEEYDRKK